MPGHYPKKHHGGGSGGDPLSLLNVLTALYGGNQLSDAQWQVLVNAFPGVHDLAKHDSQIAFNNLAFNQAVQQWATANGGQPGGNNPASQLYSYASAVTQYLNTQSGGATPGNLRGEFVYSLLRMGLNPGDYKGLINQAITGKWIVSRFLAQVLQSPGYQKQYNAQTTASYDLIIRSMGLDPSHYGGLIQTALSGKWSAAQFKDALFSNPEFIQRAGISYDAQLQNLGMQMTPNLQALVKSAVLHGYNQDEFLYYLRKTPEYTKAFPGIFDDHGNLKMSESQYLSQKQAYQQYAQVAGINIGPGKIAYLFKHDVSPAEAVQRFQAFRSLKDNQQLLDAFNQQLKFEGKKPLDRQGQFQFIMGMAPADYYHTWQNAETRYSAENAGLQFRQPGHQPEVASDLRLGPNVVKQVAGKGMTEAEMKTGFADLAKQLQTVMPQSRIQKYGLSKNDLVELEFGGPRQAAIADKVTTILQNAQAFATGQGRATTQTLQGPGNRLAGQGAQGGY